MLGIITTGSQNYMTPSQNIGLLNQNNESKHVIIPLYKLIYLHMCIAQTCIPSTSFLHASQCGYLVLCEQLLSPLH